MSRSARPTANGVQVRGHRGADTQPARRAAAALPRGCPQVDRITSKGDYVCVWLDGGPEESGTVRPPEGWEQDGAFVTGSGHVALRWRRVE